MANNALFVFSDRSKTNLKDAHPLLKKLMLECIKLYDFTVADGGRDKVAQELAFKLGRTKVHYPNSAHNWKPWVALDIYPNPIDFSKKGEPKYRKKLIELQMEIVLPTAKKLAIPIRQGVDFNRNGILTDDNFVDLPHVELFPWKEFAKQSLPFGA